MLTMAAACRPPDAAGAGRPHRPSRAPHPELADRRRRRAVSALPAASPMPVAWLGALAVAAAVFVFGFVLFARQLIGGGDVKLIAAVSLWAGPEHLALFALVTSLAGGVLALGSLWYRRWHGVIERPPGRARLESRACRHATRRERRVRGEPSASPRPRSSQRPTLFPMASPSPPGAWLSIARTDEILRKPRWVCVASSYC